MGTPTRVAFLSSCVRGGGAGWSLYYLLKHLDRTRIDPVVFVPEAGIFAERFAALDLEVVPSPLLHDRANQQRFDTTGMLPALGSRALNLMDHARMIPWLAGQLRARRVELIHCNNMMVKPIGALAAELAGIPCVLHVRNLHERIDQVLFHGAVARIPAVRRIISNSRASSAPYLRAAPAKVTVVHNGVDMSEYAASTVPRGRLRAELGIAREATVVGFTGHLIPRKGVDVLLRAAARLSPEVRIVLVGQVPVQSPVDHRAEYEALARRLGIADRVTFAGFRKDVRPAVVDFDVLVLPSWQEPFGRSIIEAMALGTPVVASRVGGIPEIITDGEDGLLVAPGDPEELARALGRLVNEPALREQLAAAALGRVRAEFDVQHLAREIEDVLLEALR